MKKSQLINEVIADAKAVKETAYQAAMGTLAETFEPTMRRVISQRLAEEGELDDEPEMPDEEIQEEEYIDDSEDGTPADPLQEMDDEEEDLDLDEILRELDEEDLEDEPAPVPEPEFIPELEDEEEDDITMESLDSLIAEMEDEEGEEVNEPELAIENANLRRAIKESKHQLKQAHAAIIIQKNSIMEVNLLNSKLMFLQKITNKHRLSTAQKHKILEAFDKASTIREAKLIYETLNDGFAQGALKPASSRKGKNSRTRRSSLRESASKPSRAIKPLNEGRKGSYSTRWMELAGIK